MENQSFEQQIHTYLHKASYIRVIEQREQSNILTFGQQISFLNKSIAKYEYHKRKSTYDFGFLVEEDTNNHEICEWQEKIHI